MTRHDQSRREVVQPIPLLTPKLTSTIGAWNVRTMYSTGRTAQIAAEMRNYNLTILGLTETRWTQTGNMKLSSGELLLYSSHDRENAPHTEGVGIMIEWKPVSSRIDHDCQILHNTEGYSRVMLRSNKRCRSGNQGLILQHSPASFE